MRIPLAILAATALALSAAACSVEDDPGTTTAEANCGAGKDYFIGMSQANNAEPYRQVMNNDVETAAKAVPEFKKVVVSDAGQDNSKQVSDVENFLTQKIDLLIISPNEAKPLTAVVKKAFDQGIPVIVLDRKVEGDAYTAFIGGDNVAIGKAAGEYYAKTLLPDGGEVIEISGLPGSTPAKERADGFLEGIKSNPKIKIVASQPGNWLRDKGQEVADALLKVHPEVDAIYAHNDPMAEGAYLAAKAAGLETKIKFTGIDALPIPSGGIKAVEQGRLAATFQYATGGREAIALAKKLLVDCAKPADIQRTTTLDTMQITKENAADAYTRLGGTS